MRRATNFMIFPLMAIGLFLVFASSCKKNDNNDNGDNIEVPVLTTTSVTEIRETEAICGGNITSNGGAAVTVRGVCWSTSQTPTILNIRTKDGTGDGTFVSNISGLTRNETYYARAYATNSKGTGYGSTISFTTKIGGIPGSFTDPRDGYVYQTITIGKQEWMAENLRYLPSVVGSDSGSQTTPLYYVYDYDGTSITAAKATANYNTYGVLYNWEAAKAAVPDGWHLPTHDEWLQLTSNTGGYTSAGGRLKEKGTMHWVSPNAGASDQFGFTALPGGSRYYDSTFINIGKSGYWWSATDIGNYKAYSRRILNWESVILDEWFGMERGFSVRCVRD